MWTTLYCVMSQKSKYACWHARALKGLPSQLTDSRKYPWWQVLRGKFGDVVENS